MREFTAWRRGSGADPAPCAVVCAQTAWEATNAPRFTRARALIDKWASGPRGADARFHVLGETLEPVEFRIDESSILSVRAPKPVGGYTETILRLIDVVFQAVAKIAPGPAMACAYGTINALSLAGHRADGRRWVMFSFFGGGHGALVPGRAGSDPPQPKSGSRQTISPPRIVAATSGTPGR